MDIRKYVYHIWLCEKLSYNQKKIHLILDEFYDVRAIYDLKRDALEEIDYLSKEDVINLSDKSLEKEYDIIAKCEMQGIKILAYDDEGYPSKLLSISDYPIILYCKGELFDFDNELCITIVGTRKSTPYGEETACTFSYRMAKAGAVIITGIAEGIDVKALEGAAKAKGKYISVLANGLDIYYPADHRKIQDYIGKHGLLISEYPPGTKALPASFPIRNRILSGLSDGTLIVESPKSGGAMITVSRALEEGRDVFAVPGNIDSEKSAGCNMIIKNGAKLVTSAMDILEEYTYMYGDKLDIEYDETETIVPTSRKEEDNYIVEVVDYSKKTSSEEEERKQKFINSLTDVQKMIYDVITDKPIHIDEIINITGENVARVSSSLTILEIYGLIKMMPGKYYVRK
ncbi:MAG: DNA-processing protein DprA [Clostridia bacterium]|nr:DNA-processing protein DprA [Clostridia bacterium]